MLHLVPHPYFHSSRVEKLCPRLRCVYEYVHHGNWHDANQQKRSMPRTLAKGFASAQRLNECSVRLVCRWKKRLPLGERYTYATDGRIVPSHVRTEMAARAGPAADRQGGATSSPDSVLATHLPPDYTPPPSPAALPHAAPDLARPSPAASCASSPRDEASDCAETRSAHLLSTPLVRLEDARLEPEAFPAPANVAVHLKQQGIQFKQQRHAVVSVPQPALAVQRPLASGSQTLTTVDLVCHEGSLVAPMGDEARRALAQDMSWWEQSWHDEVDGEWQFYR